MKKTLLFLSLGLFFNAQVFAGDKCFMAKENNTIIKQEGDCKSRHAPESTFKIPLSLMGYDSGIFVNETLPEWPFKEGYDYYINVCKGPHNPRMWMRDSCVWYSQVLTTQLGMEKFKDYVKKFHYGNQDVLGDKGKNNGLTHAWLSSSLLISPEEQIGFLEKLIKNQLPISKNANEMTKKILYKEELPGGWKLYGKTGTGVQRDQNGENIDLKHGWFVGWIEKNGRSIIFARHISDDKKEDTIVSFRARDEAKHELWKIIEELEK